MPLIAEAPGPCAVPLDIVFVIDSSGSINFADNGNWNRVLAFTNELVSKYIIGTRFTQVGVVRFSTRVENSMYLNQYSSKSILMNAISRISYERQSTNTAGGIREMRTVQFTQQHGDRPNVQNIAIVITDGESVIKPERTLPEAQAAHGQGIKVFSVGITNKVDVAEVSECTCDIR